MTEIIRHYQELKSLNKNTTHEQGGRLMVDFNLAVSIMTKSALILRDIDLWAEVHKKTGVTVMVSLTFLDEELRQTFVW